MVGRTLADRSLLGRRLGLRNRLESHREQSSSSSLFLLFVLLVELLFEIVQMLETCLDLLGEKRFVIGDTFLFADLHNV